MLVLTRKAGESLLLAGKTCIVTVTEIRKRSVCLRITERRDVLSLSRVLALCAGKHVRALYNDSATIFICSLRADSVRIGISAPPEISIYRGELAAQLRANGIDIEQPLHALPARQHT